MDERNRLFLTSSDWQTSQEQHRDGTPVEVPVPKNKISIIGRFGQSLKNQYPSWLFIVRIGLGRVKKWGLKFFVYGN